MSEKQRMDKLIELAETVEQISQELPAFRKAAGIVHASFAKERLKGYAASLQSELDTPGTLDANAVNALLGEVQQFRADMQQATAEGKERKRLNGWAVFALIFVVWIVIFFVFGR